MNMGDLVEYLTEHEPSFRKARLPSLYSDFRPLRTLNPDGYTANLNAWLSALTLALRQARAPPPSSTFALSLDTELLRALETRQWGQPLTLATVARESLRQHKVMRYTDFATSKDGVYRRGWGIPGPVTILTWGLRQLGYGAGSESDDRLPSERLVFLSILDEAAVLFERRWKQMGEGTVDRIWDRAMFADKFGDVLGHWLSTDDMRLFLKYLERDKGVIICQDDTIKIVGKGERRITPEDTTIARLKALISDLTTQIEALQSRLSACNRQAKDAVAAKNRPSALAALRTRKLVESTLERRHATLHQLEEVMVKLEQASDQIELVRVMEASTQILAGLNQQVGGVERVDDVVDRLREQMGQVDEVGNVISEPGRDNVDDVDVDEEFAALEAEERQKREAKEKQAAAEREAQEAAATKRKLDALDRVEGADRESSKDGARTTDQTLEEDVMSMKRLSLDQSEERVPA